MTAGCHKARVCVRESGTEKERFITIGHHCTGTLKGPLPLASPNRPSSALPARALSSPRGGLVLRSYGRPVELLFGPRLLGRLREGGRLRESVCVCDTESETE